MTLLLSRFTLLFIILIDAIGLGVIYPTLAYYFLDPQSTLFDAEISYDKRLFYLGLVFAVYPFFMGIGSLNIGKLSDRIGRKKALTGCLVGFCCGFIVLTCGIILQTLWLIILGRMIAGLTAGCHVIAQASMADISKGSIEKAKNISAIVVANTLGFVLGPVLGGLLSSNDVLPFFTTYTPFIATAFLGFVALIFLQIFFKETFIKKDFSANTIALSDLKLLKNHYILQLALIYFLFTLGWNFFFQFAPVYLQTYFNADSAQVGLFMSFVAFIFMVSIPLMVRPLLTYLGLKKILLLGLLFLSVSIWISIQLSVFYLFWLAIIPFCIGGGFVYTTSLSLFSDAASEQHQGHIMGVAGVVKSIAWTLAPIISGVIASFYMKLPMLAAGVCFIIALLLAIFLRQHKVKDS
ncbi:MAG: MFS transporter [Legionellales bacterium]|jgi:MFS family permease